MGQLATQAQCRIALCGGPVLPPLFAELNALPAFHRIDWPHVHLFAADERWDESAMGVLLQLPMPRSNLVRPRAAGIAWLDAARDYEQLLRAHFSLTGGAIPTFDLLLHEGGSHAAGGGSSAAAAIEVDRLVLSQPRGRLALAPAVIAAARMRLEVTT